MAKSNKTKLRLVFKFNPNKNDEIILSLEDLEGGIFVLWHLETVTRGAIKRLNIDFNVVEYLYDYFKSPEYEIVNLKCDDEVVDYLGYKPFVHWIY